MASYAPLSSSSAQSPIKKYDVFISFRGEDARTNFTSHLYEAFRKSHIKAYIDYEVPKGEEIWPELKQAIEDSYISVVVFSENYASSRWCLKELIHILDCKRDQGQLVIPVFYKVDPSHVRNQTGLYEQAFQKHERDPKVDQHEKPTWKGTLAKAADLAGWDRDSPAIRDESELIQKIVRDVQQKLYHRYPPIESKRLVSIYDKCAQIESLFREGQSQIIGIWGMGGIGKTTIARALFDKHSSKYGSCCFMENVREKSEKHENLRHKLLSCLLNQEEDFFNRIATTVIESWLNRMTVFIVLDDVSTLIQLKRLVGELQCFGLGSKIIITTRDKHVLEGADEIYEVMKLNFEESLKLFRLNAFNQNLPTTGYEELSKRAVDYADGIPLALEVLGLHLLGCKKEEWNSELEKLKECPHEDIQKVLTLSYNGLDRVDKKIFLDIACFLRGKLKGDVISLLDSYGFHGHIGMRTLQDKALINVDNGVYVEMHDLIQQMGQEIVREESIDEPKRRSRLRDPEEIYNVLANNKGTNKIEGILFDVSQIKDLRLSADTFKRMPNLRFLKICAASQSHVYLPKGLELFPNKLRYLEWSGYPLKSLPSTFCVEKLVELHMPCSGVQKLWNGVQDLVSLKRIDLSESKQLIELPDFCKALNLEEVYLNCCTSLREVHSSILSLHSLAWLFVKHCEKIKSLKSEVHLQSLKGIDVSWCPNLKEFSVSSEKVKEWSLFTTGLEMLHPSVGYSSGFVALRVRGCLKSLPNELPHLRNLVSLVFYNCELLDKSKLHIFFGGMLSLEAVDLQGCSNITELPNNTEHLSRLKRLDIRNCKRLRSLPKLPPSIAELYADDCLSLEKASRLLSRNSEYISFGNCVKLNEQSLHNISEDAYSVMIGAAAYGCDLARRARNVYNSCHASEIWLPGSGVLEWFRYRTTQRTIIIELPLNSHLLGFAFCIAFFHSKPTDWVPFDCVCYLGDFKVFDLPWGLGPEFAMNSDHVFVMSNPFFSDQILVEIERRRGEHQLVTNLKLSFEISAAPHMEEIIKEYGVHPLYMSEYEELVQQEELERNKKRPWDIDEQQPLSQSKKLKQDFGTHTDTLLNR